MLKEEMARVNEMSKEEFLDFFDKHFSYEGCSEGLYVTSDECEEGFTIRFTNLDIFEALKSDEKYQDFIENYGEETLRSYEERLIKADQDLMRNNSYYLTLLEAAHEEINEDVLDYYLAREEDFDADTLYEARDYIAEKTLEIMEEEAEEA